MTSQVRFSQEVYSHCVTQLRHAEADKADLQALLYCSEVNLELARKDNVRLREQLEAAQGLFWALTAAAFVAGVCLMALLRMGGVI